MKLTLLIISIFTFSSCAHLTPSDRVARDAFLGGAIGFAAGQQASKNPDMYSIAYGGLGVGIGAMFGLLIHDPEQVPRKVQQENEHLRRQVAEMQEPKMLARVPTIGRLPRDVEGLIRPGEWKVMSIDQWIEDGENRLIHQDQIVELVPPSLMPVGR